MNTKAMFEKKEMLVAELEQILNTSEVENRNFNEEEQSKIAQLKEEITTEENLEDKNEVDTVNEVEPTEEEKVTSEEFEDEVLDKEIEEVVEELNSDELKEKLKLFIDIHKAKM